VRALLYEGCSGFVVREELNSYVLINFAPCCKDMSGRADTEARHLSGRRENYKAQECRKRRFLNQR
jgi:hypothetical protein